MIGGFIKQQDIRAAKQKMSQSDPHTPASGKRRNGSELIFRCESQSGQNGFGPGFCPVGLKGCHTAMHFIEADQQSIMIGIFRVWVHFKLQKKILFFFLQCLDL